MDKVIEKAIEERSKANMFSSVLKILWLDASNLSELEKCDKMTEILFETV